MNGLRLLVCSILLGCACDSQPAAAPTRTTETPTATNRELLPNPEANPEPNLNQPKPEPKPDTKKDWGPQAVDMSKFDLSCKRDDECTNVRPSRCGKCGCNNMPLRAADSERFFEQQSAITCAPEPPEHAAISCGGCPGYLAYCDHGRCAVKQH